MLNFFKPISGSTKHPAPHPQKKPKLSSRATADQFHKDNCVSAVPTPLSTRTAPSDLSEEQRKDVHGVISEQRSRPASPAFQSSGTNGAAHFTVLSANTGSVKTCSSSQTVHEAHLQGTDSNGSQIAVNHVRRFKGMPYTPDAGAISFLTNMGFEQQHAIRALKVTQGHIERAANWLLSGM